MEKINKIYIFGDSIMRGVSLNNDSSYVIINSENIQTFEHLSGIQLVNKSKFGSTITKVISTIEKTIKNEQIDAALLEFGGNDCDFDWKAISDNPKGHYEPKTPIIEFKEKVQYIIDYLRNLNITPILMSLPPIDAIKYLNWLTVKGDLNKEAILSWLGDTQLIYRYQELYSLAVSNIALKNNCLFVDVRSIFLDKHNYNMLLCDDGIHPNEVGRKLIYDAFVSRVKEEGWL